MMKGTKPRSEGERCTTKIGEVEGSDGDQEGFKELYAGMTATNGLVI